MNSLFNIGYSGMRAAQIQLSVSSMNMVNAWTPGYTRQRVEQMAVGPAGQTRLNIGSGVEVTSIRRMADPYLTGQVWRANTDSHFYDAAQSLLNQMETIIGSSTSGLGEGLDNLFGALNGVTEKPENQAMRQDVLTNARQLTMRFNTLQTFISKQRADIQSKQQTTVESINVLSDNIADYNKKIAESEATGSNTSVLRDQRDELVKELSGYVDINVNELADGSYTIVLDSGQPLVSGTTAGKLAMTPDSNGNMSMTLRFSSAAFQVDMATGGSLGGLYDYQTGTLDEMDVRVTGMAKSLAEAFNSQLRQGYDLQGNPGKDLFVFDPADPNGMLQLTDIIWGELAFSSDPDAVGNNDNLKKLIEIGKLALDISGLGNTSLSGASATLVSTIGIRSRANQSNGLAASALLEQAESERLNYSGVDDTEEGMNVLDYTKSLQASMKIIATGDQIFTDLLALF